jgi:hypothetical protein
VTPDRVLPVETRGVSAFSSQPGLRAVRKRSASTLVIVADKPASARCPCLIALDAERKPRDLDLI